MVNNWRKRRVFEFHIHQWYFYTEVEVVNEGGIICNGDQQFLACLFMRDGEQVWSGEELRKGRQDVGNYIV